MNELKPVKSEFPVEPKKADEVAAASPDRFVNREFSWLQFNRRVLEESQNTCHPLLERVRFLSISADNLDEFFMVRVAGLAGQVREGITTRSADGRTPEEQLHQILLEVARLQQEQHENLGVLLELLKKEGIELVRPDSLSKADKDWVEEHFLDAIYPVMTPLSIDPAHPFPFIPNLGFSIALDLQKLSDGERMTALLRLPVALQRFIELPKRSSGTRFIALEDIVEMFIGKLFPGYKVNGRAPSASSATAISRLRKRPKISFACSKAR